MKTIDPKELRQHFSALAHAQARWEANPDTGTGTFRAVLSATKQQLAAWADEGIYPSDDLQRLRSEVAAREAMITLASQKQTRGY